MITASVMKGLTRDAFPAATIRKEWFEIVFIDWTKSHFGHFEV